MHGVSVYCGKLWLCIAFLLSATALVDLVNEKDAERISYEKALEGSYFKYDSGVSSISICKLVGWTMLCISFRLTVSF